MNVTPYSRVEQKHTTPVKGASLATLHNTVQHNSCGVLTVLLRRTSSVCKSELVPNETEKHHLRPMVMKSDILSKAHLRPPSQSTGFSDQGCIHEHHALKRLSWTRAVSLADTPASLTRCHPHLLLTGQRNGRNQSWGNPKQKQRFHFYQSQGKMNFESSAGKSVYQKHEGPSLNPGTHIKSLGWACYPSIMGLASSKFSEEYVRDLQSGTNAGL